MGKDEPSAETSRRTVLQKGAIGGGFCLLGFSSLTPTTAQEGPTTITECTTIEEPGEYVLGNDLSAAGDCITIDASDVTLDGDGHRLEGDGTGTGIVFGDGSSNATIRNLTVRNFDRGIEVLLNADAHVLAVTIEQNIDDGLWSDMGSEIVCENSTIRENGGSGFDIGDYDELLAVLDCEIVRNDGNAITSGSSSPIVVKDSLAANNGGPIVFTPTSDSEIVGTEIRENGRAGLSTGSVDQVYLDEPVPVTNCEIRENDGPGIEHRHSSLEIRGCTLAGNQDGYRLRAGDPAETILQYNNIEENEEYGAWVEDPNPFIDGPIDATCNWWGHESGPVHEDNPRENPEGQRVTDDVAFIPWSVERIDDGEGSCTGGVDDDPTTITECTTIEEPGEYVLGNDLSAEGDCLTITAPDVTLDGNGYRLEGDGTGTGLWIESSGLTVRNLTIQGFEIGIDLGFSTDSTFSSVTIQDNAEYGIRCYESRDILCEDLKILKNDDTGVFIDDYVSFFTMRNCDVMQNGPRPILGGSSAVIGIEDCRIVDNDGPVSFTPMPESKIEGTHVSDSDGAGMRTRHGDLGIYNEPTPITNCVIKDCDGAGIEQPHGFLDVRECTLSGNRVGYHAGGSPDPYETILRNSNIGDNEEYGFLNTAPDEDFTTADATCNWWGHESGPVHEDNPRENPEDQRVSDGVAFIPWSVERIDDGEGSCTGGVDDEEETPPTGTGYIGEKSYKKIEGIGPYEIDDCWGETFYITAASDIENPEYGSLGGMVLPSSSENEGSGELVEAHVIRAQSDALPVTLPTWGGDDGHCESLLFVDPSRPFPPDVEYRIASTDGPVPTYEDVETNGFAGTIDGLVAVTFEPVETS